MVSISPRMRDSLDYEEPDTIDPRLSFGFRSMTLDSSGYEDLEDSTYLDERPFSAASDPSKDKKKKRQRQSDARFENLAPFQYRTVADGDLFRLAVILPGTGTHPVECQLIWESSRAPTHDYRCLSYCWETIVREADIIVDGFRFPVTKNLLNALRNLRKPTTTLLIWIDQLCINQDDHLERGHQVSIMKRIFRHAKEVIVWLGEEDDRMKKLCEYAKRMRRDNDSPRGALKKIMGPRELQATVQRLLERPWFERVWVLPEVALARFTVVAFGRSRMSWDNLVRLIRDLQSPPNVGFDKRRDLLGNPRQRIAILTQMAVSQREGLAHTDIAQLLILAKASNATDVRDYIYSFYALTHITTFPDYAKEPVRLFGEVVNMYVGAIEWEASYSSWHDLKDDQRTSQLMSILYSAGALHQHFDLPSWIPDWTFRWHLAPIWCKTIANVGSGSGKDEWSAGIRSDFRAGGEKRETFEVLEDPYGKHKLRVSVVIFDTITGVSETTPFPSRSNSRSSAILDADATLESPAWRYGRSFFRSSHGYDGLATPGIQAGDQLAVILGGDVPVVLRRSGTRETEAKAYKLLCECFVQSGTVMHGDLVRTEWTAAEDIVLI